jgi:hypothetical protein
MRLGETLIAKGLLTEAELAKALDAQLIFGAHLGTCLLELGYIEEDGLGRLLSELHGIPYAHKALLEDVPTHIIKMLPPATAEKHLAVPFQLNGRSLLVAMVDPRSLPALDELAFASGHRVEGWITPEVRIFQALERYYGLSRRQRYVALARNLDDSKKKKRAAAMTAVMTAAATPAREATGWAEPSSADFTAAHAQPAEVDWMHELREETASPGEDASLATVSAQMCRAEDLDRLARVLCHHAGKSLDHCILFSVSGTSASVWQAGKLSGKARETRFHVTTEPIFALLMGEPVYRGLVPAGAVHRRFFDALELRVPTEILLVPIYLRDRLVAILYGEPKERDTSHPQQFVRLAVKFGLALDMLLLKKRLRLT